MKRLIVKIDGEKCDGCGLCVPACAEGALQIVDGKARLVADNLCDGLGACLGHCPRGAIGVEEREAAPFAAPSPTPHEAAPAAPSPVPHEGQASPEPPLPCGCPASALEEQTLPSLGNWPVQIRLVPPGASFLKNAHLVVAADCTAFACPDFHRRFLPGRALLVGCPKLDDARAYIDRLAAMISTAGPRAITVVHMEVPCCYGMSYLVRQALARAGATVPVDDVVITPAGVVRT
ncbi:MAG: 4Fe-4S dicluster domain-containing protein [Bacillota bacterium]|nr:4Fe-4S dicluster domain-containing protein [Bacillota bacterium]